IVLNALTRRQELGICFNTSSLDVLLPRSITSKFSEYGFIASITILLSKSSDTDSKPCLLLHGIASNITSPNFIASSTVLALIFGPTELTNDFRDSGPRELLIAT